MDKKYDGVMDEVIDEVAIDKVIQQNLSISEQEMMSQRFKDYIRILKKDVYSSNLPQYQKYQFFKIVNKNPIIAISYLPDQFKKSNEEIYGKEIISKRDKKGAEKDIENISDFLNMIIVLYGSFLKTAHYEIPISSKDNIFAINSDFFKEMKRRGVFFRGESRAFEYTVPSLYRSLNFYNKEDVLFERMKRSFPDKFSNLLNPLDQLAIMQHHGLGTRILDLTTNALVALYFAVSAHSDEDGYIIPYTGTDNISIWPCNMILVDRKIKYKEFCATDSDKVAIKVGLSQLTLADKEVLAEYYWNYTESRDKEFVKVDDNMKSNLKKAIGALYHVIRISKTDFSERIEAKDLFGVNFVLPDYSDERIIHQSGIFLIVGLDGIHEYIRFRDYGFKSKWKCLQFYVDNAISKKRLIVGEEDVGRKNDLQHRRNIMPKIKIKKEFKNYILGELNLLGINESTIYPDMDHQASYIKDYFS